VFMGISIKVSVQSQKLISKYYATCNPGSHEIPSVPDVLHLTSLLNWLDDKLVIPESKSIKLKKELEFILVSLRTELLHDLYLAMTQNPEVKKQKPSSFSSKLKFILLSSGGLLIALCEGFDSIASIMGIFALPGSLIFAAAFIFSFLSALAFCGLELIQLSQGIGVKLINTHKLLRIYLRQLEEIKQLRKNIGKHNFSELSIEELKELERIVSMLQQRFVQLGVAREQLDQVFNNKGAHVAKLIFSGIASVLFFGGAFSTGESVSLFILGLFMSSVSPLSAPVLLFGLALGLAAFTLYWCVEFPDLNSLVSGWFGLEEDRIAVLRDKKLFAHEENKLILLKEKIMSMLRLKRKLSNMNSSESSSEEEMSHKEVPQETSQTQSKLGDNFFSFMSSKSKSQSSAAGTEDEYNFFGYSL
jgi:hypothetical protein